MRNFTKDATFGVQNKRFQAYVVFVDHALTVEDKQQKGVLSKINPTEGTGFHIGVFKLNSQGDSITLNVKVPQEVVGTFKLPQVGDVVWVEEDRRDIGGGVTYVYSTYNDDPLDLHTASPVPMWGGFPGDYGHLRSHRDHNRQFATTIDGNFRTKYIRSITGYRFRHFYRGNITKGKFAVRGDSVFDINPDVSREYVISSGAEILDGASLELDQGKYPEPLNVPEKREEDPDYSYVETLYEPIDRAVDPDHYNTTSDTTPWNPFNEEYILNNKNYLSYQPVMDKDYNEYASYERELPAAEEYQVALRGNNKLLIQDQYGDGEQLLITLKNQYDANFTIVHNAEKGQIRIRDHLGQGVLLDADPEKPRVISWTTNKQVVEQGSVAGVGEFTYIRNGASFGDSQTSYGTKTGVEKDEVPNQEILMASTSGILYELNSRLSNGMRELAARGDAAGIYMRNNEDPDKSSQEYMMVKYGMNLTTESRQVLASMEGISQETLLRQSITGSEARQHSSVSHTAPGIVTKHSDDIVTRDGFVNKVSVSDWSNGTETITTTDTISGANTAKSVKDIYTSSGNQVIVEEDGGAAQISSKVFVAGTEISEIKQTSSSVDIERKVPDIKINIGADGQKGTIVIGHPGEYVQVLGDVIKVAGSAVTITGGTIDLNSEA
jgi:hypothetical protein